MSSRTVSEVLAVAAARMVSDDHDVTGAMAALLDGTVESLPADAAAVLVQTDAGRLELLAATSHRAADLELYQAQVEEGPCVDAVESADAVDVAGRDAILDRWPTVGTAVLASGYAAVHATPLRWRGQCFGALNVFRAEPTSLADAAPECRALADAATLLLVTSGHFGPDHLARSLGEALEARSVVEQAKGALAHVRGVGMADAFDALLAVAADEGLTLGQAARVVMERARQRALR
jgi:GAF domain-containing protein